jgi:hypothetical protein
MDAVNDLIAKYRELPWLGRLDLTNTPLTRPQEP